MTISSLVPPTPPVQRVVLSLDDPNDALLILTWCAIGREMAHGSDEGAVKLLQVAEEMHTEERCTRVSELMSALVDSIPS